MLSTRPLRRFTPSFTLSLTPSPATTQDLTSAGSRLTFVARLLVATLVTICATIASAQQAFEYWPNPDYDPNIPTIEEVLGYAPGERITWHSDAIRYFEALAAAAPERMTYRIRPQLGRPGVNLCRAQLAGQYVPY